MDGGSATRWFVTTMSDGHGTSCDAQHSQLGAPQAMADPTTERIMLYADVKGYVYHCAEYYYDFVAAPGKDLI